MKKTITRKNNRETWHNVYEYKCLNVRILNSQNSVIYLLSLSPSLCLSLSPSLSLSISYYLLRSNRQTVSNLQEVKVSTVFLPGSLLLAGTRQVINISLCSFSVSMTLD